MRRRKHSIHVTVLAAALALCAIVAAGCKPTRSRSGSEIETEPPVIMPRDTGENAPQSAAPTRPTPLAAPREPSDGNGFEPTLSEVSPELVAVSKNPDGASAAGPTDLLSLRAERTESPTSEPAATAASPPPEPAGTLSEALPEPLKTTPPPTPTPTPAPPRRREEPQPEPKLAPLPEPEPLDDTEVKITNIPVAPEPVASEEPAETELPPARPEEPEDIELYREKVVAGATVQVNDEQISIDEILTGAHQELSELPDYLSEIDYRRKATRIIGRALRNQIDMQLLYQEADKYLEEAPKKHIENEMENKLREMLAATDGSVEKLRQKCRREGTTLEDLLDNQRRDLTVRIYLYQKFEPAVVINRRMLWNYYVEHEKDYTHPKKVQMQLLVVPLDDPKFLKNPREATDAERRAAKKAAEEYIRQARRKLDEGADFSDVVREYSLGTHADHDVPGLWPLMGKGNKAEEKVEAAAFAMSEGEISDIIFEEDRGYYIVKVYDVQPGRRVDFEEAQDEIAEHLKEDQIDELRAEYIRKIYDRATVYYPENFLELAVDRAVRRYYDPESAAR